MLRLNSEKKKIVYSIGHSSRRLDELLRILKGRGIEALIDIRSYPRSKRNPDFNRENLSIFLPGLGIDYVWIKELGGMREEGYEEHFDSEEFERGITELLKVAESSVSAFMCAELKWRECHRSFVAEKLFQGGWEVIHIYDETETEKHSGMIGT